MPAWLTAQIASFLLAEGADVDMRDVQGRTALHWAVFNSHYRALLFLLDNHADPTLADLTGLSSYLSVCLPV